MYGMYHKKALVSRAQGPTRRGLGWNSITPFSRTGKPSRCVLSCQVWNWSIRISQNESNRQTALFTYFGSAGKRQKSKALALLFHSPPHPPELLSPYGRTAGKDQMEAEMGRGHLTAKYPEQKAPAFVWTCGVTARKRGKD